MRHTLALSALVISIFISGCGGSSGCLDKKLAFGYVPLSNCEESQLTNSDDSIIALRLRNAIATTAAVFIITPP
jgi:hypothetical protein